jgi:hypothetical protein
MMRHPIVRGGAILLITNAAYLCYKCPCKKLLSCHKEGFLWSVGGATLIVVADNVL